MDFFTTYVSERAIQRVTEVLRSGLISEGKCAAEFERELQARLGLKNPVTLNSGTAALHLGLVLAGVNSGDEVILPPQTFVASGLVVLMCNAKPVFADIQPRTGNICAESICTKITDRTKAIMPVHWAGYPCDMHEIHRIADENSLTVIEDAAHALGATYRGEPIGAISRFTAFSFQAIKHLTTGDGGALCCLDEQDYQEARRRRWFGIDRNRDVTGPLGEREYNLRQLGFKYHLNDFAAALGLGNLPDIPQQLHRRRELAQRYRTSLKKISGITLLENKEDRDSACWLFTILVEGRDDFIRALKGRSIPTSVVHRRIDRNQVFGGLNHELVNEEWFDARQVALPLHHAVTDQDQEAVVAAVVAGW